MVDQQQRSGIRQIMIRSVFLTCLVLYCGLSQSAANADEFDSQFQIDHLSSEIVKARHNREKQCGLLIQRADLFFSAKEYDKAEQDLENAIALNTKHQVDARSRLSRVLTAAKRYTEARACVDELERIGGATAHSRTTQAMLQLLENDLRGAIRFATEAINLDDQYGYAFYIRGIANLQTNQYAKALEDFDAAIALQPPVVTDVDPPPTTLFLHRSRALDGLGRHVESTMALGHAYLLTPDSFEVVYHYAARQYTDGYFEDAAPKAARAVKIMPESREAIQLAMNCYDTAGDVDRTIEFAEKWVKVEPDSIIARQSLCRAIMKSGDGERAIESIELLEQLDPNSDLADYERIMVYALCKDQSPNQAMAIQLARELPEDASMTRFKWITKAVGFVSGNDIVEGERCLTEAESLTQSADSKSPLGSDRDYVNFVRKAIRISKAMRAKSPL